MAESSSEPDRHPAKAPEPTGWWASRLRLTAVDAYLRKFAVPQSKVSWTHALGGALVVLLLLEAATGLLLSLYYRSDLPQAHASVTHIVDHVRFGWLIRSLHHVGADAIVLLVVGHGGVALFRRSFRAPRELTWWTGGGLGLLIGAFAYSGGILPWERSSLYAVQVGSSLAKTLPWVGPWLANALMGGAVVGPATLHRAFVLHTGVLPAALILLGLCHVLLVHLHGLRGNSNELAVTPEESDNNLRAWLPRAAFLWLVTLVTVLVFAALSPLSLQPVADLAAPSDGSSRPAWYFMALYQLARGTKTVAGLTGAAPLLLLTCLMLATAPWWGAQDRGMRGPKTVILIGSTLLLAFVLLTALGYGS